MVQFISFIQGCWTNIFDLFEKYKFNIAGHNVSYFTLIFGFLVLAFVISYFWKGARA